MKSIKTSFSAPFLLFLLLLSFSLCSFSLVPVTNNKAAGPPLEKRKLTKAEKHQKHLQKRQNHLYRRFEQAKSSKRRLFLQKKIRKIEQQQQGNPAYTLGAISFLLGVVAAVVFVIFLFFPIAAIAMVVYLFSVGIATLAMAITALVLARKNPENSHKGFAIAAVVIGGLLLSIGLFFLVVLSVF